MPASRAGPKLRRAPLGQASVLAQGQPGGWATGQRRYWRLQNIEACNGLADYVDIYF